MAKPKKSAPSDKKAAAKKKAVSKVPPAKKSLTKKPSDKPKAAAKKAAGPKPAVKKNKADKPTVKKEPAKKPAEKKPAAAAKPAAKGKAERAPVHVEKAAKQVAPKVEDKKPVSKAGAGEKAAAKSASKASAAAPDGGNKRDQLRNRILGNKKAFKPIAFTLDEAREIAKTHKTEAEATATQTTKSATPAKPDLNKLAKAVAPSHVKAASLADILGFNPKKAQKAVLFADPETIPEKYRRYYKILLELRASLTEGLSLHTEETLRRSTKDDAGDLSSYGQHMADAGTDTFDRDFALSMVANEQEALTEIDAAIKRIQGGTYGICEITQKPIAKERLLAVPFTRYSAEAQKELEKNRMRVRTAAGLFGEIGDDTGRADDVSGGDEE